MNSVVIGLCVYNSANGLPSVLKNIDKIKKYKLFTDIKIIACYDNSDDDSLDILNSYEYKKETAAEISETKTKNIEIIKNECRISDARTESIAFARNKILERIREKYSNYEYFIMMDTNEYSCIGDINVNVLEEVIKRKDEWDSLSFDREAGYYDIWALSFDPFLYSVYHFDNFDKINKTMRDAFTELLNGYKNNKPDEYIDVYSAFNGCAIYKTEVFLDCSYSSNIQFKRFPKDILKKQIDACGCKLLPILSYDCEHRAFHMEAKQKNNAKIKICTKSLFSKLSIPQKLRGPA
jgi:hypothetical protein